jgi:hypothetical protein
MEVPGEVVAEGLRAVGAAVMVVVVGGQIEAIGPIKVTVVALARRKMRTRKLGRSARGRLNPMVGTTRG